MLLHHHFVLLTTGVARCIEFLPDLIGIADETGNAYPSGALNVTFFFNFILHVLYTFLCTILFFYSTVYTLFCWIVTVFCFHIFGHVLAF